MIPAKMQVITPPSPSVTLSLNLWNKAAAPEGWVGIEEAMGRVGFVSFWLFKMLGPAVRKRPQKGKNV
jgi:hypothetical protein